MVIRIWDSGIFSVDIFKPAANLCDGAVALLNNSDGRLGDRVGGVPGYGPSSAEKYSKPPLVGGGRPVSAPAT